MKKEKIIRDLETIFSMAKRENNEAAHRAEKILMWKFIKVVAGRQDHLGEKARLILTSFDIIFERNY